MRERESFASPLREDWWESSKHGWDENQEGECISGSEVDDLTGYNKLPLEFTVLLYFLFLWFPSSLSHGGSPLDSKRVGLIDFSCSCQLEAAAAASNCAEYPGSSSPALFLSVFFFASMSLCQIFQGARKQRKFIGNSLSGHEIRAPWSATCGLEKKKRSGDQAVICSFKCVPGHYLSQHIKAQTRQ